MEKVEITREFYLIPVRGDGHKDFYGKSVVRQFSDGSEVLMSYLTPVVRKGADGKLTRLWDDWSATTGRHVKSYCGLDKKGYEALPMK